MSTFVGSSSPQNPDLEPPLKGSCHCMKNTYTLQAGPIRINCCHCLDCQHKTGSAFLTNLLIERSNVVVTSTAQPMTTEQSPGLNISRCGDCYTALWSTIPSLGPDVVFVRVGTLQRCKDVKPDVHFFTRTKVEWLSLPDDVRQYVGGRPDSEPGFWTDDGKKRLERVLGKQIS